MKRPNKAEPNQVLQIHHVVEAYEDTLIKEMAAHNLTPEDISEVISGDREATNATEVGYAAAFGTCHILHNAVHDLMGTSDIRKIEDVDLRRRAIRHTPRVKDRLTPEQYNDYYKNELGL